MPSAWNCYCKSPWIIQKLANNWNNSFDVQSLKTTGQKVDKTLLQLQLEHFLQSIQTSAHILQPLPHEKKEERNVRKFIQWLLANSTTAAPSKEAKGQY